MIVFYQQVKEISDYWRSSGNHHMGIRDLQEPTVWAVFENTSDTALF